MTNEPFSDEKRSRKNAMFPTFEDIDESEVLEELIDRYSQNPDLMRFIISDNEDEYLSSSSLTDETKTLLYIINEIAEKKYRLLKSAHDSIVADKNKEIAAVKNINATLNGIIKSRDREIAELRNHIEKAKEYINTKTIHNWVGFNERQDVLPTAPLLQILEGSDKGRAEGTAGSPNGKKEGRA